MIADSVFDRMSRTVPVYAPPSLFNLGRDMMQQRQIITDGVCDLAATNALASGEKEAIASWSRAHLQVMHWSACLQRNALEEPAIALGNQPVL